MTTDFKNELTIVRVLNAPRDKVWRACRDVEALKQWWGLPTTAAMPGCTVDFRVGGAMHCEIVHDGNTVWFKWIYREIAENEKLVLEQHFSDADGNDRDSPARPVSMVTLLLEDMDGKTKLTVTHTGMASHVHAVEDYKQGWSESLDRFGDCLTRA